MNNNKNKDELLCEWCEEAPRAFRCSMCNPRRIQATCRACTTRWHSRGFSQEHLLEDMNGTFQSYKEWFAAPQPEPEEAVEATTSAEKQRQEPRAQEQAANASLPVEITCNDQETIETEPEAPSEPLEPSSPAPVEFSEPEAREASVPAPSEPSERSGTALEPEQTASPASQPSQPVAPDPSTSTPPVPSESAAAAPVHLPEPELSELPAPEAQEPPAPSDSPETTPTFASLTDLLVAFDRTNDHHVDQLAQFIHQTMAIEDAVHCCSFTKCTQSVCLEKTQHFTHWKKEKPVCENDPICISIYALYNHMRACNAKERCPFCIRVLQRRALGALTGFEHWLTEKRKQLRALRHQSSSDRESQRNFYQQEIDMLERRKRTQSTEVDRLSSLALQHDFPILNFPPFAWHVDIEPVQIKSEPGLEAASQPTTAPVPEQVPASAASSESAPEPSTAPTPTNASADAIPELPDDHINHLLCAKQTNATPNASMAFQTAMDMGYAIVDASFCSPIKAPRCLLQCHVILQHLQHHLDWNMCSDAMCTAVEHHFSHLSKCTTAGLDTTCEYCLRIKERELARAVDVMEQDQPDADARVQAAINALTASFTSAGSMQERQQAAIQLEDELEQAEDHKRELLEKLNTARLKLRRVRKCMAPRAFATTYDRTMAPHFVKVTKKTTWKSVG